MTFLFYIAFFILSIILQITIIPLFSIKGISPDLILILVISVSIQRGKFWGVVAGFSTGLVFDAFGTALVGLSSLANSISAFVAGFLLGEQVEQRLGVIVGLILVSLLIHDFLYYTILSIGTSIGFWVTLFKHVVPQSFYTLIFMVIIHMVLPRGLWAPAKKY
ncbi:rod shape-determining protein MreD [candidate division KSB1 bacterium]|jgi:rod shape-determining protein MreD|nr:rod shape-determining protein MreD [candidate division KSB1 bacterium]